MELILTHHTETQVSVSCDNQPSHTFNLLTLVLKDERKLLYDPVAYGKKLYEALFPHNTLAQRTLAQYSPSSRLLLVIIGDDLDAIPWEYTYGPDGFLVQKYHFVRGLPVAQRRQPPARGSQLHIVAIPSNPLSSLPPLNIEAEWIRLKEIIESLPFDLTLERTRPATIEQMRNALAGQQYRIIHFMGHGEQDEQGALLCFEKDNGKLDRVTAEQFTLRVHNSAFLVTLNACVSARPGPTPFSNLAAALVQQKTPYALGMRLSFDDKDASTFSRAFYNELARGVSVEETIFQTRLTIAQHSSHIWAIGVPVLYTSLAAPPAGFTLRSGRPTIKDPLPSVESSALPHPEGTFQGRTEELIKLGDYLTGDSRKRLVTIHGGGGQGKTALAREAIERFAYAWPGGVWATTFERLPNRVAFATALAQFLGISTQEILDAKEVERKVFARLALRRTLIVLDNVETLVEAVEQNDEAVLDLVELIQQLPGSFISLLVTSRIQLGWSGEESLEIGGLTPEEGAQLFIQQCASQQRAEIEFSTAKQLSEKVAGHPLGLRLLGKAFNETRLPLADFIKISETKLVEAENKYVSLEHRHRTIFACIEISIGYLDAKLRSLLIALQILHAPFLADAAVYIFDPETEEDEKTPSPIREHLHILWQHGLLTHTSQTTRDETLEFYHLLPTTRLYIEHYMEQDFQGENLLKRFGLAYAKLGSLLYNKPNTSATTITIAQQSHEDFERGIQYVGGIEKGYYLLYWGRMEYRLGNSQSGLELLKYALEIVKGLDKTLEMHVLTSIAAVYQRTGKLIDAQATLKQVLSMTREMGDQGNEATTLSSMASVLGILDQPQQALCLYEEALPLMKQTGHGVGEAVTLYSMAKTYLKLGQPQKVLVLLEQALIITQEIGDRVEEANVLNNMGYFHVSTGQRRKALDYFQQALPLLQEVGDPAVEATVLNNIGLCYLKLGEPRKALEYHKQQALPLMDKVKNDTGKVDVLNNMSSAYLSLGQLQKARECLEDALPLTQVPPDTPEVGYRVGEATTFNNMGQLYAQESQLQDALDTYQVALSIAKEVEDRDLEATIYNNMATVFERIGQRTEALDFWKKGHSINKEIGDRVGEAYTLTNMGLLYMQTGEMQEAFESFQQALPIMQEAEDRVGEVTVRCNIGLFYAQTGQLQKALEYLEQTLLIVEPMGDFPEDTIILNNIAGTYQELGQLQKALDLFERALLIRKEAGDRDGEVTVINNMGMVYLSKGQQQEALKSFLEAQEILQEINDRTQEAQEILPETISRTQEATILNNIGLCYSRMGQPQKALQIYEQGLPIVREIGDLATEAKILINMATAYQRIGQQQEASQLYEKALPIMQKTQNKEGEVTIYNNQGEAYLRASQPQQALDAFQKALPIIKEVGKQVVEANIVNNIATTYVSMGQAQEALKYYEKALSIWSRVDNRAGEAITWHGMAYLCQITQDYPKALEYFEKSVELANLATDHATEIAGLIRMALLLYQSLHRPDDAIARMKQALAVFKATDLPQDMAGHTPGYAQSILQIMHAGTSLDKLSKKAQRAVTKAAQTWQKFLKHIKNG